MGYVLQMLRSVTLITCACLSESASCQSRSVSVQGKGSLLTSLFTSTLQSTTFAFLAMSCQWLHMVINARHCWLHQCTPRGVCWTGLVLTA